MMDLMARTPRLPIPGETMMGGPFKMGPGGKGANQAVAAARLGADVTMVVSLGTDYFGEMALANLAAEGIDTRFVRRVSETHTGAALITVDDVKGENMIVVAPGSNSLLLPEDLAPAEAAIASSDYLLLQLEIPLETVTAALELAAKHSVPAILNPAPARSLPDGLLSMVGLATPNETEAQLLTGVAVTDIPSARAAGERLLEHGVQAALVTLGANGALAVTRDGSTHLPGFRVNVVDSTGAGDAFNGALAVGLAEGRTLAEAIAFANAAAALSVTKIGTAPAMPLRAEVAAFLKGLA